MIRPLSNNEINSVSGGKTDFGPTEVFYTDGTTSWGGIAHDWDGYSVVENIPSMTNENGDIIVRATPQMVANAHYAYNLAADQVEFDEYFLAAAGPLLGFFGPEVAALGGASVGEVNEFLHQNQNGLVAQLADVYYQDLQMGIDPVPVNID